ncbi:hypothetical protein J4234_02285 [Candidatus Woesearchaeota archaeon]|nr:hypothetical protein [Candidatus Woesearchaeota archaeon]
MSKTFKQPENGQYYLGKVRSIQSNQLRVSVFVGPSDKLEEHMFDVGKAHFPAQVKVDDTFKYFPNGMVEVVQPQELSELESRTLFAEVEAQLPQDEF